MKTKSNVQKKTTKLLTLVLMMSVVSLSVSARTSGESTLRDASAGSFTHELNGHGIKKNASSSSADIFASYLVEEKEEALELEAWMTNETRFDVYSQYSQIEEEEALEVEAWMTNESIFNHWTFQFAEETESQQELEAWMTSDKVWNP